MNPLRYLSLLLLSAFAAAGESAQFYLETCSVPATTWVKIPTAMRDDHALLRTKLLEQARKGSVQVRDRIGGPASFDQQARFSATEERRVPVAFGETGHSILPTTWEFRTIGSSLEIYPGRKKPTTLSYELSFQEPALHPLLQEGNRLDVERTKVPRFSRVRFESKPPLAPVTLVALAPDPSPGLRDPHLVACFLVSPDLAAVDPPSGTPPHQTIELLGLRGSTTARKEVPAKFLAELLRYGSSHLFSLGASQVTGQRLTLSSVREFPHPSEAGDGPNGPIPSQVATLNAGTNLSAHLLPPREGTIAVILSIDHDLRDPIVPSIPGKGIEQINQTFGRSVLQFRVRQDVPPGEWVILGAQPLSPALGPEDRDAKGMSCYLFGRVTMGK